MSVWQTQEIFIECSCQSKYKINTNTVMTYIMDFIQWMCEVTMCNHRTVPILISLFVLKWDLNIFYLQPFYTFIQQN